MRPMTVDEILDRAISSCINTTDRFEIGQTVASVNHETAFMVEDIDGDNYLLGFGVNRGWLPKIDLVDPNRVKRLALQIQMRGLS